MNIQKDMVEITYGKLGVHWQVFVTFSYMCINIKINILTFALNLLL